MSSTGKLAEIDYEWVNLLKEAKLLGLTVEEVWLILYGGEKS
ncbi:hypothetical protein [Lentibacillus sp.]|nr:hypothetical protein [Lentibacillus sp.]HLS09758.1 hypothetical protein [Lentibacillus sp.]